MHGQPGGNWSENNKSDISAMPSISCDTGPTNQPPCPITAPIRAPYSAATATLAYHLATPGS